MLPQALHEIGEAGFFFNVAYDEWLLRLQDPAGRVTLGGRFAFGRRLCRNATFEDMEAHNIARWIVKDESEEVELHDGVQALGEVVEKRGKIALLRDGLADFQQGFELAPGVFERCGERRFRRRNDVVRHSKENSTRAGEGSTDGALGSQCVSDEAPSRRVGSERCDNAAAFIILNAS